MKKSSRPEIPRKAIYRLSVYLRCLHRLKTNAIRTVSSDALAAANGSLLSVSASARPSPAFLKPFNC